MITPEIDLEVFDLIQQLRQMQEGAEAVAAQISTVRQALRAVDPDLPVLKISAFSDFIEKNIGLWVVRLGAMLFALSTATALCSYIALMRQQML